MEDISTRAPPVETSDVAVVQGPQEYGIHAIRQAVIEGDSFGESNYMLYQACSRGQEAQQPYLLVWLHGQDNEILGPEILSIFHRRLERKTYFFVPTSPKPQDGNRFQWGLSYTKAENFDKAGKHQQFVQQGSGTSAGAKKEHNDFFNQLSTEIFVDPSLVCVSVLQHL